MKKTYVTFGQGHFHNIMGQIFNPNTVAVIPCSDKDEGRALAFAIFGPKFSCEYHEEEFKQEHMQYFPEGQIIINEGKIIDANKVLREKECQKSQSK